MSAFSPATLIAKAVEALTPDVAVLNNQEKRRYLDKEIPNWKLNRDAGHPAPIPEPPLAYGLLVDSNKFTVAVVRGTQLVCDKYVDAAPTVPLLVSIGAAIPGMPGCFSRGYVNGVPDNSPNGYQYQPFGAGGPTFIKVIEPSVFGFTAYYKLV